MYFCLVGTSGLKASHRGAETEAGGCGTGEGDSGKTERGTGQRERQNQQHRAETQDTSPGGGGLQQGTLTPWFLNEVQETMCNILSLDNACFLQLAAEKFEEGERALQEAKRVETDHEARLGHIHSQTERLRQQEQRILQVSVSDSSLPYSSDLASILYKYF